MNKVCGVSERLVKMCELKKVLDGQSFNNTDA